MRVAEGYHPIVVRYVLGFGCLFQALLSYADDTIPSTLQLDENHQQTIVLSASEKATLPQLEELWLEVRLNQQPADSIVVLKDQNQELYFSDEDLKRYRIKAHHLKPILHQQQSYYALKDLEAKLELNLQQMTLSLDIPTRYFEAQEISTEKHKKISMTPTGFGSYLNYDMVVNYADYSQQADVSGAFEWVVFSPWGSFNNTFLSRQMNQHDSETVRLESYFRWDDPQHRRTLIVGDTMTNGTAWSGGVHFAGVQWGTNNDTQPNINRLPFMSLTGEVLSPATLDIYVNNALQSQQKVDAGAFSLNDIATVSGQGVAKVVVKDVLGRQQVISQNFYTNPELLRQGLNDYQFEIGTVRQDYGREDFSYAKLMATGTWRRGISRNLTLESHAQMLDDRWMIGMGGYHTLPYATRLGWVYANSYNGDQYGKFTQLSLRKQASYFNLGVEHQLASEDFWKLGQQGKQGTIKQTLRMYSSFNLPRQLNLSLNYAQQENYQQQNDQQQNQQQKRHQQKKSSMMSFNLSKVLNRSLSLQMLANHSLTTHDTTIGIGLNISLNHNKTASIHSQFNDAQATHQLQLQKVAPVGTGTGYELRTNLAEQENRYEAGFTYKNNYLNTRLQLAQYANDFNMRASFEGAMTLLDGQWMASRKIEDSFGLVRVENLKNVRFYAENQEIGRTNKQGYGVVPRLRPYQNNQLLVEQADLPMNVDIRTLTMKVTPYLKSGVLIDFPIKVVRDAFFILVDEQQQPLKMGTLLHHANGEQTMVGARGEVYLFDVPEIMDLTVNSAEQTCVVSVDPEQFIDTDMLPTLLCRQISDFNLQTREQH